MLFDGFELIKVDDLPAATPVQTIDFQALRNAYSSERQLVPGRIYILRQTTKISSEDLGVKLLPKRLARIGAKVTKAPHNYEDFIYLYFGKPLFMIEFEKDGHHGWIFNRVFSGAGLVVAYQ